MFDVAGVGASSVDLVYVLPAYPSPEGPLSKLPIHSHFISCGGQTATAMAACAALGLRAAFAGTTGSDPHGQRIRDELAARGVDISQAQILDGPQPYAVILLAESGLPADARGARAGERIVLWRRDAPAKFHPAYFPVAPVIWHVDDVDEDAAIATAAAARAAGRRVTTDIDRVTPRTRELIGLATHPILAEHVPSALTGEHDLVRALRLLRSLTAGPLIVTRGRAGAIALDDGDIVEAPGFAVDAVDTTGAGDVFRAGFIAALIEGLPLADGLRFANAAAAVSCTRRGAMASVPSRADVERLVSRQP